MLVSDLKQMGLDHTNFVPTTTLFSSTGEKLCTDKQYVEYDGERDGFPQGVVYAFKVFSKGEYLRDIYLTEYQVRFLEFAQPLQKHVLLIQQTEL